MTRRTLFSRSHKSLLLLCLGAILGCGSSPSVLTPAPTPLLVAGNWQMEAQDIPAPANPTISYLLLGALSVQGTTVSGNFRIVPALLPTLTSPCVQPLQVVPFTGTVDASNLLTLTSTPFSGSTATLQLQLPLINNIALGTAQIVGGPCATPSTPLIGVYVPSVTGTYAGTLTPIQFLGGPPTTNTAGPATITVTQSAANPDGQFPVTATLTFNSTSCALSATPFTGTISGLSLTLNGPRTGAFSLPATIFSAGAISLNGAPNLNSHLEVFGTPTTCSVGLYSGNLARQ